MHRSLWLIVLTSLLFMVVFSGCLWVEKAQYTFNLNADGSGDGTIRFINICYEEGEDSGGPIQALDDLISQYIDGTSFENSNPGLVFTGKKLLEENNQLVAEVSFTFASIDNIGFFRYKQCDNAVILYIMGQSLELLPSDIVESNGKYAGASGEVPVYAWSADTKQIQFSTITKVDSATAKPHFSLLDQWKSRGK